MTSDRKQNRCQSLCLRNRRYIITVYELIQELSKYRAETEVRFHAKEEFDTDVEAEFDRENEDDTQEVTVTAEFDGDLEFDDIGDYESPLYVKPHIQINLSYLEATI